MIIESSNTYNKTFSKNGLLWLKVKKYFPQQSVYFWILKNFISIEDFYSSSLKYLKSKGWPDKLSKKFIESKRFNENYYISFLNNKNIKISCIEDENYPFLLKTITDPPPLLFYKGNFNIIKENCVSVVGSRKCSDSGKAMANKIAAVLAKNNYTIVSGLAAGIDAAAHKGAIKNGNTAAILGCGLDFCYPAFNKPLYNDIEQNGCLISEYFWDEKPLKHHFPFRNRIISGLAETLIVVEASEKSGSLITANYALDNGRDVLAVPGNPYDYWSKGCNRLIKDGAFLVDEIDDINLFFNLKKEEKKQHDDPILNILKDSPKSIEEIRSSCSMETEEILSKLTIFEINNDIYRNDQLKYCLSP